MSTTSIEVIRRKDGLKFKARIRLYMFGKKVIEICKTHKSRSKAELWLEEAIQIEKQEGLDGLKRLKQRKKITVGDSLNALLKDEQFLSSTGESKVSNIKLLAKFPIANIELSQLRPMDLISHCKQRKEHNPTIAPSTLATDISNLSSALTESNARFGYSYNGNVFLLGRKLLKKYELIGKSQPRERILDKKEMCKLKSSLSKSKTSIPILDIFDLLKSIGARRSELMNLRWSDYDKAKGVLIIRSRKSPNERKVTSRLKLNDKQKSLILKQEIHRVKYDDRIFPYNKKTVSNEFRKAVKRARINDYQLRDLKAHAITSMFRSGKSLVEVSKIVGNRNLQILNDHYIRIMGEDGLTM